MSEKNRDLTGQRFGRWTVVERDTENPGFYFCRCDCGTERSVLGKNLVRGGSRSCGCARKKPSGRNRKLNSLVGQRFGKLTVVEMLPDEKCRCICDCGNEKITGTANLRKGGTSSCGCLRYKPQKDLTGQRFGRLTAVSYERTGKNKSAWRCKCDCGKEVFIARTSLVNGHTRSCGCLRRDLLEKYKKYGYYY